MKQTKVMVREKWNQYFQGFTIPFSFYDPDEYQNLLKRVGLIGNVQLTPDEMIQEGKEGLKGFIRSTWVPLTTNRIPEDLLPDFVEELVQTYIESYPLDSAGLVHIPFKKLEVDATKV
jgi:trans-aconitate methyltransferase